MAKFDYKKTLEKGAWGLLYALVTGLLVMWQDNAAYAAVLPLLMMAQNYIKHR